MLNKRATMLCFFALVSLTLAACGGTLEQAGLRAEGVWAWPAMAAGGGALGDQSVSSANMGTGAVFMRLVNGGPEVDRLVGARTDVAAVVEIHETIVEGDVMKMRMLPQGLEIPARSEVLLQPGSYHIMLIGLKRDLVPGVKFALDLQLEKAGTLRVEAKVRAP